MLTFGNEVKIRRKERGYRRQQDLADALQVGISTIARIEQNRAKAEEPTTQLVARFLGIDLEGLGREAGELANRADEAESLIEELRQRNQIMAPSTRSDFISLLKRAIGDADRIAAKRVTRAPGT